MDPFKAIHADISLHKETIARPATVSDAVGLLGGKNSTLAALVAGTDNKKSNEYKAAMRDIQRYRLKERGAGINPKTNKPYQIRNPEKAHTRMRELLDKAFNAARETAATRGMSHGFTISYINWDFVISEDERNYTLEGLYIDEIDARNIMHLYSAAMAASDGERIELQQETVQAYSDAVAHSYAMPVADGQMVITDISDVDSVPGMTPLAWIKG